MCEKYRVAAVILKIQLCSMGHQQIDHIRVTISGGQHEACHATPGQKKRKTAAIKTLVLLSRKVVHGLSPSPSRYNLTQS